MNSDQPLPHVLKAISTASLLKLEERALDLGLSQRLPPSWVASNAAPSGTHYLWPALWHDQSHRPEVPHHLRCELLIALCAGERVRSLLDVLPGDFAPLPRVTSRDEGRQASRFLESAPSVREWLLREDGTLS
jgi:hypothetical protein